MSSNNKKPKAGKKRGHKSRTKRAENPTPPNPTQDSPSDCEQIAAIPPSPLVEESAPPIIPAASSSMPDAPPTKQKEELQRYGRLFVLWQDPAALVEHEEHHRILPV